MSADMRHKKDPQQKTLFDPYERVFSEVAYRRIRKGWQEVFRRVILKLMPVDLIEKEFHPTLGCPTKELYSMAGLLLIKEFKDWTVEEAMDAYMFHSEIQYALNLEPSDQSLSTRTIERYEQIFREHDLAIMVMNDVTTTLIEDLELSVGKQRLDSTHIMSDMATFGRTRLMGVTIRRFLVQVKRHNHKLYKKLPEDLRQRYTPTPQRLFGDVGKAQRRKLRQQVAEDLHWLIEKFADNKDFKGRKTYQMLLEVFEDQCEVKEGKIEVKKLTGGSVIQNTSDPDATYDGHKGPGYKVQICETCSEENEVQLITSATVQTAAESDRDSLAPTLEDLEGKGLLPEMLLADTAYGRDENVHLAEQKGVDLQSPVADDGKKREGKNLFSLNVDDFVIDPETETVQRCPAGCKPASSVHTEDRGETLTIMPIETCAGCEFGGECPIKRVEGKFQLRHTAKQRRLAERRREQTTAAFRETYAKRSGGESTNSGLKRREGLGRLRVRGMPAVRHSALLKIAGWNILRAAASAKMKAKMRQERLTANPCREKAPIFARMVPVITCIEPFLHREVCRTGWRTPAAIVRRWETDRIHRWAQAA